MPKQDKPHDPRDAPEDVPPTPPDEPTPPPVQDPPAEPVERPYIVRDANTSRDEGASPEATPPMARRERMDA